MAAACIEEPLGAYFAWGYFVCFSLSGLTGSLEGILRRAGDMPLEHLHGCCDTGVVRMVGLVGGQENVALFVAAQPKEQRDTEVCPVPQLRLAFWLCGGQALPCPGHIVVLQRQLFRSAIMEVKHFVLDSGFGDVGLAHNDPVNCIDNR